MSRQIVRGLFVVLCGLVGLAAGSMYRSESVYLLVGLAVGVAAGALLVEWILRQVQITVLISALVGLVIGLLLARFLLDTVSVFLEPLPEPLQVFVSLLFMVAAGYIVAAVAVEKGRELRVLDLLRVVKGQPSGERSKILDTSVIIDGRIADICETGFIEGTLIIPQFVLRELQHIADSSDPIKRNRGRRGLDILQKIQKNPDVQVKIHDMDFPDIREVDGKLVAMAKALAAKVVTNDFNLNKVAELYGVSVLNINELTNALRPVVLPGEEIRVYVLKEGKEYNQGVAYLDDGTMVVIDNGRRHIGQTIDVCVTSVLQTTAGRMIFSRLKEEAEAA
ncbi:MAG: PIN domain-containing protein [candidate division NC10 bacterium]|nr:TRAM domain-containing protein [candidate division NC10 bacterium]MCZ6552078.1 TRAM domain-containing protein [candidate division NC10 bacterium]